MKVLLGLFFLLFVTLLASYLPISSLFIRIIIALFISAMKGLLILFYFMHVKFSEKVVQLYAMGGVLWAFILFALMFADFYTRLHPL